MYFLTISETFFQRLFSKTFQLPSLQKLWDWWFMINKRLYSDENFWKIFSFFSYKLLKFLQEPDNNRSDRKRNIGKFVLQIFFVSSFTISSASFSEFDNLNMILFQIKVFGRNIAETTLASYFIKVTAHSSFMRLRVIGWINRVH